ncbi:MAG: phosphoribosylanthranilate isomerase [Acetatifactor sp.]|nr:phosphoribosylanthranilate isomerase [Acetatifactor sp.]
MTQIKLCGLSRECDIEWANELQPDYIGFVFAKKSRRYVTYQRASELKELLHPSIKSVGVFVNEEQENIAELVRLGVIDVIQLHGCEDEHYLKKLRELTSACVIQAFSIKTPSDLRKAEKSSADCILLDAGAGGGKVFDWSLLDGIMRPYFLAGGLTPENLGGVLEKYQPYGVDASSSLETDGMKDREKMAAFVEAVREKENNNGR